MRDALLVLGMVFFFPAALRAPAAGLMCWVWFSIMNPHRQVYGFAYGQPLSSIIAAATLFGWAVSRENKRWPPDAVPWLMLAFLAWTTIDTPFAVLPGYSWDFWNLTMRLFVMVFMVFCLITNKARVHGLIWVIVISLGYYGVKGGVFTLAHGGHAIVYGPPDSVYGDNNQLAVGVVTELPLLYYLWRYTRSEWLRLPLLGALVLQVIMVFGSYSRGGVIALSVMMAIFWLRSDRKLIYGLVGAVVVAGALSVMPDSFFERLHTVNSLETDDSFQGRLDAWRVAFLFAVDHFPLGAGFSGLQLTDVFEGYSPGSFAHAAHSIYFQVLGDHGFIGLALFLIILVMGLRTAGIVLRQTRDSPELRWAYDLADMIRISLVAFYVGGAALSMAYSDVYLLQIATLSCLRHLTRPSRVAARSRRLMPVAEDDIRPGALPLDPAKDTSLEPV